jgi:hypothetical protein
MLKDCAQSPDKNCSQLHTTVNICGLGWSSASPATETCGELERLITREVLGCRQGVGQGGTGTRKLASLKKHFLGIDFRVDGARHLRRTIEHHLGADPAT